MKITESVEKYEGSTSRRILMILGMLFILALSVVIMIPNFLGGRSRSKVSRARADQRSIITAIESYAVDNGSYPAMRPIAEFSRQPVNRVDTAGYDVMTVEPGGQGLMGLTTPVAYLTSLFQDPYANYAGMPFAYWTDGKRYLIYSQGPDANFDIKNPASILDSYGGITDINKIYDPTNGNVSNGDILRSGSLRSGTQSSIR